MLQSPRAHTLSMKLTGYARYRCSKTPPPPPGPPPPRPPRPPRPKPNISARLRPRCRCRWRRGAARRAPCRVSRIREVANTRRKHGQDASSLAKPHARARFIRGNNPQMCARLPAVAGAEQSSTPNAARQLRTCAGECVITQLKPRRARLHAARPSAARQTPSEALSPRTCASRPLWRRRVCVRTAGVEVPRKPLVRGHGAAPAAAGGGAGAAAGSRHWYVVQRTRAACA